MTCVPVASSRFSASIAARVRVLELSMTKRTSPAAAASNGASASPSVGGPSITTSSKRSLASAMIFRMRPGRQEVGGARRNRPARQKPQILVLGLDDMIVDAIVGRQELAQADRLARGLERRLAKVAVDQQHGPSAASEILRQRQRGGGLAFARFGAGQQDDLRHARFGAEPKRRHDRGIGLRDHRRRDSSAPRRRLPSPASAGPRRGTPSPASCGRPRGS